MDRIVKIIGNAQILRIEKKTADLSGWERRSGFLGFEGYLVIKDPGDGRFYACIDNGYRCITTSCGELTFSNGNAVFTTANSIYTFQTASSQKAG